MARIRGVLVASAVAAAVALTSDDPRFRVFPPPQVLKLTAGSPQSLSAGFSFTADPSCVTASPRLDRALARYSSVAKRVVDPAAAAGASKLSAARVCVEGADETLSVTTDYSYDIFISPGAAPALRARSVYGALYAMESFVQLFTPGGVLEASAVELHDAPAYSWRGLMIDSGRRFFPVPVVENLLDTLQAAKLSVLHLHASDHCRFGVESRLYPNLTAALTGVLGGFYSQSDIAGLVAYAQDRGVRIVPEFDVPGHSRGFIPIQGTAVQFCQPDSPTRGQLYGDPQGQTVATLQALFGEMASLFPDAVFHIGSDETSALGPCTTQSTFALERSVLDYVQANLSKTPAGWEEVLFDAGAATPETVVYAWANYNPYDITVTGRKAVNSADSHWYFTSPGPSGPAGWSTCWYDPGTGLNSTLLPLLLGGEMSMWTDTYCYIDQCGASNGAVPVGAALFPPAMDSEFGQSVGGMIFPRGLVGAGAFWNFNASVDPSSPAFVSAVNSLNDAIAARGSYTCPTNCSCDQLTACGVPYIKPTPPQAGDTIAGTPCADPVSPLQAWQLSADGLLSPLGNSSLCVLVPGYNVYPLPLGLCSSSEAAAWRHDPATSELVEVSTGNCLDMAKDASLDIGTFECGSGQGLLQANQQWALDGVSGLLVSLYPAGGCVTAVPQAA